MAEPWHKLELPKGYLPTSDAEKVYDLSQDVGITLTENEPFGAFSTQPNDPNWGAYSLGSGTQGLTGKLTITGANIVKDVKPNAVTPQGEFYGIAYSFTYHGPLNVSNGLKLQNSTHSGTVGAFASKTNP